MDRWEWTRVGSAIAGSALAIYAIGWFTDLVYTVDHPARLAYQIPDYDAPAVDLAALQRDWPDGAGEPGGYLKLKAYMADIHKAVVPVPATAGGAVATVAPPPDLGTLLASADPAKGERLGKVCATCHSFDQGGPNLLGPNLWAVVGRPVGSHGGFNYSAALKAHGGTWSYEALDAYIASPARAIPGNRMGYAGMRRAQDRADLLAWLASHGSGNVALPAPKPPAEDKLAGL